MGVATGCGCKEVYRFPHTTYPYSSCICSFLQQHPYFLFIFLCFSFLYIIIYIGRILHSSTVSVGLAQARPTYEIERVLLHKNSNALQCPRVSVSASLFFFMLFNDVDNASMPLHNKSGAQAFTVDYTRIYKIEYI